jgi:phosphate transport system protein
MSQLSEFQLGRIRETLLLMSSLAGRNLALALRALMERSDALADTVELEDSPIDQLEVSIDEMVVAYMATQAPVATDCRFMIVASKIGSDLERIGDQATTIVRRVKELNQEPPLKPLIDVPLMAETAHQMLRDSISAFVEAKPELAQEIIGRDTVVDDMNRQLHRELTSYMIENPKTITRCLHLMTVGKAIERVGDHVQNIAEDVYYLYSGRDIRYERISAA